MYIHVCTCIHSTHTIYVSFRSVGLFFWAVGLFCSGVGVLFDFVATFFRVFASCIWSIHVYLSVCLSVSLSVCLSVLSLLQYCDDTADCIRKPIPSTAHKRMQDWCPQILNIKATHASSHWFFPHSLVSPPLHACLSPLTHYRKHYKQHADAICQHAQHVQANGARALCRCSIF